MKQKYNKPSIIHVHKVKTQIWVLLFCGSRDCTQGLCIELYTQFFKLLLLLSKILPQGLCKLNCPVGLELVILLPSSQSAGISWELFKFQILSWSAVYNNGSTHLFVLKPWTHDRWKVVNSGASRSGLGMSQTAKYTWYMGLKKLRNQNSSFFW